MILSALGAVPSLVSQSPAVGRASLRRGICSRRPYDSHVVSGSSGFAAALLVVGSGMDNLVSFMTARIDTMEEVSRWKATARKETLVPCGDVD